MATATTKAESGRRLTRPNALAVVAASLLLLIGAALLSAFTGAVKLPPADVVRELVGIGALSARDHAILWDIRLPRVAMGIVVGATLAIAGAAYQAVFRNPLADPYLLGVSSGAGLGVTLAVVAGGAVGFGGGGAGVVAAAFAGGVIAVSATYMVSRGVGHGASATVVVLAGVAVAAFANAAQTFIQQRNIETIQRVYSWMLGNLGVTRWGSVALVLVPAAVCWLVLLGAARVLDVMTVGDLEARTLGVDPATARLLLVAVATLGTAAVVSVSGLIGFVGIIVPHALRLVVGPGHRLLLPLTLIWGAIFLLLADTFARTVLAPAELPVGVVAAAVGAPFFLFILRRFSKMGRAGA
ncbi:FecCD family ABC transporter permease [Corynebacterium hansenii]|uniref:FecCD family ABC transporter permease n=1 Tax=Corynebacterium hansenii TaxID=394964 RepID=A0ABV7ZNF4_9CORY|nr:iron ABC transporter permease [Corynebacterium hansenii]WJY98879.1 Hemin transport system permease protein HmuU [Corynebacterium hansenii]